MGTNILGGNYTIWDNYEKNWSKVSASIQVLSYLLP